MANSYARVIYSWLSVKIYLACTNGCRVPVQDATGRLIRGMPLLTLVKILLTRFKRAAASHRREIFGHDLAMRSVTLGGSDPKASVRPSDCASTKLQGTVGSNMTPHRSDSIPFGVQLSVMQLFNRMNKRS